MPSNETGEPLTDSARPREGERTETGAPWGGESGLASDRSERGEVAEEATGHVLEDEEDEAEVGFAFSLIIKLLLPLRAST